MSRSKLFFFLVILMLITVGTFMAGLEAQNTEKKRAPVQEFVKMAQEFVELDQIEKAIEIYERIVKAVPEDFESRAQLATLYSQTNQHENASHIWSELLEVEPENTKYQDELFNSLQDAGKYNEALELVQAYIQVQPEVGINYARLAKLYAADDRVDEVIANYEKAIELGHNDKETNLKLAEFYFVNGNIDAAEKRLKNAILSAISKWDRQSIERQLVNLYRYQGNLEEMLQKAEDEGTLTYEMQKERARHFLNTGEFEKSTGAFKKAVEMTNSPNERIRIVHELLMVYLKQGRTDLALEFYDAEISKLDRSINRETILSTPGITVKSSSDDARKTLINAYKDQGELEGLRTIFEDKLEKDADNPNVIEMLAEIYWEANDYQKAAEAYHMLSKAEPSNVRSFYHAAAAFHKSNQPDMVKAVLNQADTALASSNYKGHASFICALATICFKSEMYDPAIKLADDAATKEEKNFDKSWALQFLYEILAESYLGAKRYEEAYAAYRQMAKAASYSYTRQRAETKMNKIAKAEKLYEKWIPEQLKKVEQNPNDPKPILKLAKSYEATDRIKEAIGQYEKLSELQPYNPDWHKKLGDLYGKLPIKKREAGEVIEGTALMLSGNGSYVEMEDSESLDNITDQVTVSAWIKPTSFPNNYVRIIFRSDEQKQNYRQRSYILVIRSDGKLKISSSPKDGGYASLYSPPGLIKLNTWTHIAGVIDAKKDYMKIFVNGHEFGHRHYNGKDRFVKCRLPLRIGVTHIKDQVQTTSFIGQIDEVRIWNIARTEAEIHSDMNKQLNGDEPGLVGYWKFDEETEGKIVDTSPNKNDGKRIGNAKLEPYTRPIFESLGQEQLAKSISSYEIAVGLEPTSYQLYDLLAKTYIKASQTSQAEATYRQALDAPLKQSEHDSAIRAISALYTDEGQENKHIAFLEEIKPTMDESAVLHELLGDHYKKVGDSEKAELAYTKWLHIRQKALNSEQRAWCHLHFVNELLDKELFPETALKFAKLAFQRNTGSGYDYPVTLGHACIANGLYDEALKHFKHALSIISNERSLDYFWQEITEASKKANDKERYFQMLDALTDAIRPGNSSSPANVYRVNVNLSLAEYYSKNNMPDKAMEQMRSIGVISENAWLTLGPFDNTAGIGYNTEYIPEGITQIDLTAKYEGVEEQISWKKFTDDTFDGFVDMGRNVNWRISYAFATVTSPDEREVQFRFDSDDQGKLWLNGKEVFSNPQAQSAVADDNIILVTLKAGKNTILVKVCNEEESWGFYLRVTDADGKPYEVLQYSELQNN